MNMLGIEGEEVGELVRAFAQGRLGSTFEASVPIGAGGLGLDSIAIVELLVACEARFGVAFPDKLLENGPLTLGRLVRHLQDQRASGPPGAR